MLSKYRIPNHTILVLKDMQKQPLFSVLIANYNNGKYLMEAIESVRQQTYTNWEIILVDDASTDNSKALYQELGKDPRIHIYYNEQNMGCGYTKRRCAEFANGEICGFLDPDDALIKDALQVMVNEHCKHPEASLINSTCYIADADMQIISKSTYACQIPPDSSFLEYGYGISHFATFKKNYYNKTIGIRMDFKRAVDHYLYYLLEEAGDVVFVDIPLYIYRQGTGNNISIGVLNMHKALCWDMLAMADACKRRNISIDDCAFARVLYEMDNIAQETSWKKEIEIRNSKTYRLGAFLLKPMKELKRLFE